MKTKYLKKPFVLLLSFALLFPIFAVPALAAATAPDLGDATTFGLLADTMTTVNTSVYGDVGAVTQTVVPFIIGGTNHINDAEYAAANIARETPLLQQMRRQQRSLQPFTQRI